MFSNLSKYKAKWIGESIGICHCGDQYYLAYLPDYSNAPITLVLDTNDNKEEAINMLTKMKDWLTNGDDGDLTSFNDKDNQEYHMNITETLFTKSLVIYYCENEHDTVCWLITRRMLNKAIRILKSW